MCFFFFSVADQVPGSAVLLFDVELVEIEEGLPEGYMFIWNEEVPPGLFAKMDRDNSGSVEPSEVWDITKTFMDLFIFYILTSVKLLLSTSCLYSLPTTSCSK